MADAATDKDVEMTNGATIQEELDPETILLGGVDKLILVRQGWSTMSWSS